MENAVNRLARSDAVCIVGIGVAVKGLELSSLFPCQRVSEIRSGVALCIVSYRLAIKGCEQILPSCIAVGVSLAVLFNDIAVVVILHRVDNFTVDCLGKKLTKCVISIFGYTVDTVCYLGDSLFRIILIRKSSSVRKNDLADKLRGSGGLDLSVGLVLGCYLT